MKRLLSIAALAIAVSACSRPTPEMRVINDAAAALGGTSKVLALKSLSFEGGGTSANLGQNATVDGPLPTFDVSNLKESIDLEQPRFHMEQTRTANFPYPLPKVSKQNFNVDGDVAFNVGADGTPARTSARTAADRRLDRLHHPVSIVRAALQEGAKVTNLHQHENLQVVDIATPKGDTLTLAVDSATHLPVSVTSQRYDVNLGDVAVETKFDDYKDVDGVQMPMHLVSTIDKYAQNDFRISKYTTNVAAGTSAVPDAVKTAKEPPMMAAPKVDVQQVGDGVWFLGGQSHASVLVQFADHTVLIETPQNEARALAAISAARDTVGNRPLMKVVVTHHHFDHEGGIRAAVSEGLTLVAHESNKAFFTDLVKRQHTIYKDALSQNPRVVAIETFGDHLTMKDDTQTLELYDVPIPGHVDHMVIAWLPKDRIIIQGDLFSPTFAQQPFLDDFLTFMDAHKLKPAKHVPIHGPVMTQAEFEKAVAVVKAPPKS